MLLFSEFFSSFLDEEFDVKAHANKAIQGVAITEQLAKLADGMALLDKEIHHQVFKYPYLLLEKVVVNWRE